MTKKATLETAKRIYPYRIERKCGETCDGHMRPVGMMLTIDPPLFPHRCNKCGRQENFQTNYPHIEYRDAP